MSGKSEQVKVEQIEVEEKEEKVEIEAGEKTQMVNGEDREEGEKAAFNEDNGNDEDVEVLDASAEKENEKINHED